MASGDATRDSRNYRSERSKYRTQCTDTNESCWLCGQAIDYTAPASHPDSFELDHYYPVSTHPELVEDPANFRASHSACNRSRGDTQPDDLLAIGELTRTW